MSTKIFCMAAFVAILVETASREAPAAEADPLIGVRIAIDQLDGWLGSGANAQRWRGYLQTDALRAQLANGPTADVKVLTSVLKQYDSGAAGLDEPRFARVRDALHKSLQQLSASPKNELADALRTAGDKFKPADPAKADAARATLEASLAKLDRYLSSAGTVGDAWRKYLQLDALKAALQKSDSPNVAQLRAISKRFLADEPGLELPQFYEPANALVDYINQTEAVGAADLKRSFSETVKKLNTDLDKYSQQPGEEAASEIGQQLSWLERNGQLPGLVRAVRRNYSLPNLYVQAKSNIVAAGIERSVDDESPVRDVIMGTNISGMGHTLGRVEVELVPDARQGVFDTLLTGKTATRTVGYNGPATIRAKGVTELRCRQRVVIDPVGLGAFPAEGSASTSTKILGVSAGRGGIVQRIASSRVAESKGQAEAIGSQHAARKVEQRLSAQTAPELRRANQQYQEQFRAPLMRMREFPEVLLFNTTRDWFYTTAVVADPAQLAAPDVPPATSGDPDLTMRVHESLPNNLAAAMLAGVTLTEEEVQKRARKLLGKIPDELKSEPDRPPWTMVLALARPVSVTFDKNGFAITIRGTQFSSANAQIGAMDISAKYTMEITPTGSRFVRQGELDIRPPGAEGRKLSVREVAPVKRLRERFERILKPEFVSEGLELPGQWKRAGKLKPTRLESGAGWLVLQWVQPTASTTVSAQDAHLR